MSWNGSGVYSLPTLYFPEAPGNLVDSDRYNGTLQDIATGLNVALTKNGQNLATANLPMGGYKHLGAGAATAVGEYLIYSQAIDLPAAVRIGYLANIDVATVAGVSIANYGITIGGTHTGFGGPGMALAGYSGLIFSTNGVERMRLNNPGNLTINAPTSGPTITAAGNDGTRVADFDGALATGRHVRLPQNLIGGAAAIGYPTFGFNAVPQVAGTWNYAATDFASAIQFQAGGFQFLTAPSGTAGNTITLTNRLTLTQIGNLVMVPPASPPALAANGEVVMNLTSNTNFRISARGSDGVTRVANITLA